jgi:hypothetical protein
MQRVPSRDQPPRIWRCAGWFALETNSFRHEEITRSPLMRRRPAFSCSFPLAPLPRS